MSARRAAAAVATVAVSCVSACCGTTPALAAPETSASIHPSFSPDRLGSRTAVTFAVRFSGGEDGVPAPVHRAVVQVPAGLGVEFPNTRGCTRAHLEAHGASACPARSQIGSGHAVVEAHLGSETILEDATLWAFMAPSEGALPSFEILGQGYSPLEQRAVLDVAIYPDRAPYWAKLVVSVPSIPTLVDEPDASAKSFSLTIGTAGRPSQPGAIALFVPKRCPAGGFPWTAEFTYAGGSTDNTTATIPCP